MVEGWNWHENLHGYGPLDRITYHVMWQLGRHSNTWACGIIKTQWYNKNKLIWSIEIKFRSIATISI